MYIKSLNCMKEDVICAKSLLKTNVTGRQPLEFETNLVWIDKGTTDGFPVPVGQGYCMMFSKIL